MNGCYDSWKMNLDIMEPLAEVDGFEPQTRQRSNTWPLPRPDNYVEPADDGNKCPLPGPTPPSAIPAKKNSSRRNAWGNLSYADLITQAITSSPDKRLTLSQIYEWMVANVPYFKDKGDSNSSAGWKVSARWKPISRTAVPRPEPSIGSFDPFTKPEGILFAIGVSHFFL